LRTFLRESYTLPLLVNMPLVAALLLMQRWFVPHNYRGLGLQLIIAGAVYGLGILATVLTKHALRLNEFALNGRSGPSMNNVVSVPEEILQRDI